MGVRETINSRDGHIYYVVETSDGKKVYIGVFFLEHYEDLSSVKGEPGLWFVRDAAADETGQHGDPTVHKGWAMYTWDDKKPVTTGDDTIKYGDWRKVAEQESVDGPWGIDEVVRKTFVTKVEFNQAISALDDRLDTVEERSLTNEQNINNLSESVRQLEEYKHKHDNLAVLSALESKGTSLSFEGKMVGGFYLYDNVVDGVLYWKDPTDSEATAVAKSKSQEIAVEFAKTSIASAGMSIAVMEADGTFTKFALIRGTTDSDKKVLKWLSQIVPGRTYYDHDTSGYTVITETEAKRILTEGESGHDLYYTDKVCEAVPESTVAYNGYGSVIFVTSLPAADVRNDGRGVWYPVIDDGSYEPGKFYISVDGVWKSIDEISGGTTIAKSGAAFITAYSDDDPLMPFKKNHLFFSEPEDDLSVNAWWGKTTLVRKFGSEPDSITDGVKVAEFTDRTVQSWIDTCPYSTEPVYYRLFSKTRGGSDYIVSASVNPQNITWANIFAIARNGLLSKVFSVGDTIVLPKHPTFGMIECEVIAINEVAGSEKGRITIASKDALAKLAFGTSTAYDTSAIKTWLEKNFTSYTKMVETSDSQAQTGKTYYVFGDSGYTQLEITAGADFPEGVIVYEVSTEFSNGLLSSFSIPSSASTIGFSKISKTKYVDHLKTAIDWWTTDISGDKIVSGNSNNVDPTTELGAVVVFVIQEQ